MVNRIIDYNTTQQKLVELANNLDYITAFYINGSRADNYFNKLSDIDFTFYVKLDKHIDFLKNELKKILIFDISPTFINNELQETWKTSNYNPVGINIFIYAEIKRIVQKSFISKDYLLSSMDFLQHKIIESKILYDPKGQVYYLKGRLKNLPKTFMLEIANISLSRLSTKLEYWKSNGLAKGPFQHISHLNHIIHEIALTHYMINNKLMQNSMKSYYLKDIKQFKPNILKEIKEMSFVDYNLSNSVKKIRALENIIKKFKTSLKCFKLSEGLSVI